MPREIEDYVHRIGRTGRSGKTGIATTFVSTNSPDQILLDLKYLLKEAKQRIPPFLESLEDRNERFLKDEYAKENIDNGKVGLPPFHPSIANIIAAPSEP